MHATTNNYISSFAVTTKMFEFLKISLGLGYLKLAEAVFISPIQKPKLLSF